jgi:hypothetical protein
VRIRSFRVIDVRTIETILPLDVPQYREPGLLTPVPPHSSWVRSFHWLESLLAMLATALICAIVAMVGLGVYVSGGPGDAIGDGMIIVGWAVLIGYELRLLYRIVRFYHKRLYPLPLLYAVAQPVRSSHPLRYLAATSWLVHALVGILAFTWLKLWIDFALAGPDLLQRWLGLAVDLMVLIAGAHACVMFILLALREAGAGSDVIQRAWSARFMIDLLIVGIAYIMSPVFTHWIIELVRLGYLAGPSR